MTEDASNNGEEGMIPTSSEGEGPVMSRVFSSCSDDPKGSVHRAWGVSLIFLVLYFIMSIVEMLNLKGNNGSLALMIAAIWTGVLHLILAILGTFILKRFPTSFALGFLIGILLIVANQNLILFGIFHGYAYGSLQTNHVFSSLCFTLSVVLLFFTTCLVHFRKDLVVSPIDVKGSNKKSRGGDNENASDEEDFQYGRA
mmetsp:Transcript_31397/g.47465  ORF Transcript_31397/g.47465 Transcript_31397/m.47465 type:complete len:199 (-) Transcript_31397:41-637(-)|eukprot:CAMPEP_0178928460 /NCGR_PEP_ID=MMETSP0786-20121207/19915_1 /TAXON_ID=186022 /ORGANISM="Thalassionema frauenfeldii, Strain CCMP 1798" /LENGTH=198 /DNA_ID=CAMNT_0020604325 /DNA_START=178 /DNA_END=774 /DNA_ORIENTATION=-